MEAQEHEMAPIVKIACDDYSIQIISVVISPGSSGKRGHAFSMDIMQCRSKTLSSVDVDINVLKELNDALLDINPTFSEYVKFPSLASAGFSGLKRITDAQLDERAGQLTEWMSSIITSVSPSALVILGKSPFVGANPAVKDPSTYPVMPSDLKFELAALFQIPLTALEPLSVQLPQNKSVNDITAMHIKTALEALGERKSSGEGTKCETAVDADTDNSTYATYDLPKVSVAVTRQAKSEILQISKKFFYVTELKLESQIYSISKEFSEYRKLYEDLRMRGIGFDIMKANGDLPPPPLEPVGGDGSSSDEGSDSGFEAGQQKEKKPKVKEIFSNLLTSKPTRHGSFSEIEIDIELSARFPRKFHTKLTSKDLHERCNELDSWMRSLLSNYHRFSLESKDITNIFLGLAEALDAENMMHLINIIDRITHANAVSENSHIVPAILSPDSSHSDVSSLTAGTTSNQKDGATYILKNAVAAIGSLVHHPTLRAVEEKPKDDESSSSCEDSSSMPVASEDKASTHESASVVVPPRAVDETPLTHTNGTARAGNGNTHSLVINAAQQAGVAAEAPDQSVINSSQDNVAEKKSPPSEAVKTAEAVSSNNTTNVDSTEYRPPMQTRGAAVKCAENVSDKKNAPRSSGAFSAESKPEEKLSPPPHGCCTIS